MLLSNGGDGFLRGKKSRPKVGSNQTVTDEGIVRVSYA
jgi:hypothetical protein